MEIFTLETTQYWPSLPVRDYKEFVWVERYRGPGEFKLVVEDDTRILNILPINTLISHSDTREIMWVENQEIKKDINGKLTITITGRSFEIFFEYRALYPLWPADTTLPAPLKTAGGEDYTLAFNFPGITRPEFARYLIEYSSQMGFLSLNDVIPNFITQNDVVGAPVAGPGFLVQRGSLYESVMEQLNVDGYGIRNERPLTTSALPTILITHIHNGVNRAASVLFSVHNDDFSEATYFRSNNNSRNVAPVSGHSISSMYYKPGASTALGLNRRVLYVEVPEKANSASTGGVILGSAAYAAKGEEAIAKLKPLDLMAVKVSPDAFPRFNVNYGIGDTVTAIGDYGSSRTMRVTEHILSSDEDGLSAYPTLDVV